MPDDIVFDGGSEADRREIMNALDAYLSANARTTGSGLPRSGVTTRPTSSST